MTKNSIQPEKPSTQTKSNMLKYLQKQICKSKIEKIYDFTTSEWQENHDEILKNIAKNFNSNVIVRSSAIGEDSNFASQAGNYESILNVNPKSKSELKKAVNQVIKSYIQKNNINNNNQILIQNQSLGIITSGVVFTRTTDIGAPYYVINFEDGSSTISVTQGSTNKTIKFFRDISLSKLNKKWNLLLQSIREIESILNSDLLDIEFGITKSLKIIIFQVRSITTIKNNEYLKINKKIKSLIDSSIKKYSNLKKIKNLSNSQLIFSDMSDWNPSEIIGNNPNLLDYSLYDYLIMKNAWHKGRSNIGYQKMKNTNLMIKFGNKPYVDITASFNSLIPDNIDKKLKRKLINYYLSKLSKYPQYHDKVEFEILFTCYDASTTSLLNELTNHNFSKNEIQKIKQSLIDFTNNLIDDFPKISENCAQSICKMKENRKKLFLLSNTTNPSFSQKLKNAEILLSDCRTFGTIPFATLARIAFIATAIFKSLVIQGIISTEFFDRFMNSINTPLSEFQSDLTSYYEKKLSESEFLSKYGHLRPGTYDITETRYDKKNLFLDDFHFSKPKSKKIHDNEIKEISEKLKNFELKFSSISFSSFVKRSLIERENLKFEFTHNLSDALELIADAGNDLGFKKEDMSHLDINTILITYKKFDKTKLKKLWSQKIDTQKKKFNKNNFLVLPPVITSKDDFQIIDYFVSKPNFVTSKSETSKIVNLDKTDQSTDLNNKIILLKNADPGYDWIFTKNPSGLITQYGGVASHMAIRCAEIGLPAAIGCGEMMYEKLKLSSKVLLDCKNQEILILEYEKNDELVEIRKTLKSLGYIK